MWKTRLRAGIIDLIKRKLAQHGGRVLANRRVYEAILSEFEYSRAVHLSEELFKWQRLAGISPPERNKTYKSCRAIETGLAFMPTDVNVCCMDSFSLGPYGKDKLDFRSILARRKLLIGMMQKGEYPTQCRTCDQLHESLYMPNQWLLDYITIAHYTACNLRCSYCYTVTNPAKTIPIGEIQRLLPHFQALISHGCLAPNSTVNFSGGEPAILPEFEDLISLITNYGMFLKIHSNSTIFSEAMRKGLKTGRTELILGIDCATPELYKRFKGNDLCDRAWETAALYVRENPDMVHAKIVVTTQTVSEAGPFVERAANAGFRKILYSLDCSVFANPSEAEIEALAIIRYESERCGIDAFFHEKGAPQIPEFRIKERVEEQYSRRRQLG